MVQSKEQYSFVHLVTKDFISEEKSTENGTANTNNTASPANTNYLSISSDRRSMSGSHPIPDSIANCSYSLPTSSALNILNENSNNYSSYNYNVANGAFQFTNNSSNNNLNQNHTKNRTYIMATSKNISGSDGVPLPYKNHSESII
jgi:hypothetical protein